LIFKEDSRPMMDCPVKPGNNERMPHFIHTEDDLKAGVAALIALDPRMRAVFEVAGHPPLRKRPGGFPGLAAIVCAQQLSTASAAAIWGRLIAAFDPFDHDVLRRARNDRLARLGLSAPKIRAMKAIAKAVGSGALDLEALAQQPADDAHAALTAVHGIGPWTADIYLLFCLGHADAWPAGDLALQEAMRLTFKLKTRPSTKDAIVLAEGWRPWRGAAACLLWTYYRAVKGRSGAPIQANAAPSAASKRAAKTTKRKKTKQRSR
jgi:DNA-3-methyladenine glycosylase II